MEIFITSLYVWGLFMWKSNSKKGYTLIEVVCSLTILSILLLAAMITELYYFSLKRYNQNLVQCTCYLEALKSNLRDQYSYADINSFQTGRNYYVSKENINIDELKEINFISDLLVQPQLEEDVLEKPYIEIRKDIGEGRCINIKLTAHIQNKSGTETLRMEFLKGDY